MRPIPQTGQPPDPAHPIHLAVIAAAIPAMVAAAWQTTHRPPTLRQRAAEAARTLSLLAAAAILRPCHLPPLIPRRRR